MFAITVLCGVELSNTKYQGAMAVRQLLFVALVACTIGLGASDLAQPAFVGNNGLFKREEYSDGIEELVEAFDDLAVAPSTGMYIVR